MISELHEKIADMIVPVYRKVDWKKQTSMKRSAVDVLAARIRVASCMQDVPRFFEKLCHGLHLTGAAVDPGLIDELEKNCEQTMKILREEAVYIALLAQKKAKSKTEEAQEKLV